jgi:hypothetical protein
MRERNRVPEAQQTMDLAGMGVSRSSGSDFLRVCTRAAAIMAAAWGWRLGEDRRLIIVNLSDRSQARVPLPWEDMAGRPWRLTEAFTGKIYERDGLELRPPGLSVDLDAWQFHFFQVA